MRNVELTKSRILEAATEEFASYGFSGARVDRIAINASANKALIYTYFGNKEQLFVAVLRSILAHVVQDVRMDALDLPGYLERRLDWLYHNPALARISTWVELDPDSVPDPFANSDIHNAKLDAIQQAQRAGVVTSDFSPQQILAIIDALARPGMVLRDRNAISSADFDDYKRTASKALRRVIACPPPVSVDAPPMV